jgi:hypothetical protein
MQWPHGKSFAFTVFDDPDAQTLSGCRKVYDFISDLGLKTTIGVWPCAPVREPNSAGETCANPDYLSYVQELRTRGFEVGYHNTTPHSSTTPEIAHGLEKFRGYFGDAPITMANHYNSEAIYWGQYRLTGMCRQIYRATNLWRRGNEFVGHIRGSNFFWGDLCKQNVRYCRNFVFGEINTLRACPWMPYHDPDRAYVNYWYASSEGANIESFVRTLSEENQDRLENEGGACIMYAHFGHGFVKDEALDQRFRSLFTRLAQKNGWFVPVADLLAFLQSQRQTSAITSRQRASMEWRWLRSKLMKGTS